MLKGEREVGQEGGKDLIIKVERTSKRKKRREDG
jgi:hypothetical protein